MPNIEIIRFNHFTARKSERYTATHNGLYVVEEGSLIINQPSGERIELNAGDFTLYNSADLRSAEAKPGVFKAVALVFDIGLFSEFKSAIRAYSQKQKNAASTLFLLKTNPRLQSLKTR